MGKVQFIKIINAQIEQEKDYLKEHEEIKEILKSVNGEFFTHKVLNSKRLKTFEFRSQFGMFYIIGKYQHLAGYDSNPHINYIKFEEFDSCHFRGAKSRILQLENIDKEKLFKLFSDVEKTLKKLRLLFGTIEKENLGSYHNPVYHNFINSFISDVKDEEYKRMLPLLLFVFVKPLNELDASLENLFFRYRI